MKKINKFFSIKRIILLIGSIVLVLIFGKALSVAILSPFLNCGYESTAVGAEYKNCICKGIPVTYGFFGGSETVCLGRCHRCQCSKADISPPYNNQNIVCSRWQALIIFWLPGLLPSLGIRRRLGSRWSFKIINC